MNKYFIILILVIMPLNSLAQQISISNFVAPVTYFIDHTKQLKLLKHNLDIVKAVELC